MFATTIFGHVINAAWSVIVLCFWIAIAFWPARVASRKGHSFFGFFLLSLFFFPLALIAAYLVGTRLDSPSAPTPTAPSE